MRKSIAIIIAVLALQCHAQRGSIMTVDSQGNITPSNIVGTIHQLADAVAAAEAAAVKVEVLREIEIQISNAVHQITLYVNSLESVGYINGYVLEFEGAISVDTNAFASIVRFTPDTIVSDPDPDLFYCKINTYFSAVPATAPVIRYQTTLGRTNAWTMATVEQTFNEDVSVTNSSGVTVYETYAQIVSVPAAYRGAFFRVFGNIPGGAEATMLNVNNGISVNGRRGLTKVFSNGVDVIIFTGGVCTQN